MVTKVEQTRIYEESGAVASAVDVSLQFPSDTHCFIGVDYFSDELLTTSATPTAGTITFTVQTVNSDQFVPITNGTLNADTPEIKSFAANPRVVRATPTGIVGATHYKVTVTANRN